VTNNNCIDNNVGGGDRVLTGGIHPTHAW